MSNFNVDPTKNHIDSTQFLFQVTTVESLQNGTNISNVQSVWFIGITELRTNTAYVHAYSLIGSTIVMLVIPVIILITTYFQLRKSIPSGGTRNRTTRILAVIITMFLVCHIPKVCISNIGHGLLVHYMIVVERSTQFRISSPFSVQDLNFFCTNGDMKVKTF